jgi:hypothetical protein
VKTPYSYTILRYMHDPLIGEFINVGVALLAPEERYASAICRDTYRRLAKTFPTMNGEAFKNLMRFIRSRFAEVGDRLCTEFTFGESPTSVLEIAHSILPADDSSLQWSPPGSGLTDNPSKTLEGLFQRMVMAHEEPPPKESRDDDAVWRTYKRDLESRHVLKHLRPKTISVQDDSMEFQYAFQNGVWHCLEPISFDLIAPDGIREKAHRYLGQILSVKDAPERFKIYMLIGRPQDGALRQASEAGVRILRKAPVENEIYFEEQAAEFSARIAGEIASEARA